LAAGDDSRKAEIEEEKQDLLRRQKDGTGHWKERLASESESIVGRSSLLFFRPLCEEDIFADGFIFLLHLNRSRQIVAKLMPVKKRLKSCKRNRKRLVGAHEEGLNSMFAEPLRGAIKNEKMVLCFDNTRRAVYFI
jgi:hypothetical protein